MHQSGHLGGTGNGTNQQIWRCAMSSKAATSAAPPATAISSDIDTTGVPINIPSISYKPLPLSNFRAYRNLVSTLYGTSLAMILGNSLEWLDFGIYGYSSAEISSQLFGGSRAAYWASFGLGFATRPLGAYVLGKLSDEKSRKLSFVFSMLAMSASTALMALIPAVCNTPGSIASTTKTTTSSTTLNGDGSYSFYCVSSLWASAVPAIFLRCVQGFSAGAAAGGVNVIQTELWSTTERKGAIAQSVGVQNTSGGAASVLSAAVVYGLRAALGEARYAAWGWRVAFLIVVPPSLLAIYLVLHKSTPESNDFAKRDGRRTIDEDDSNDTRLLVGIDENKTSVSIDDEFQDEQSSNSTSNSCDEDEDDFPDEDEFPDEDVPFRPTDTNSHERSSSFGKGKSRYGQSRSLSLGITPSPITNISSGDDSNVNGNANESENTNTTPRWLLISVMIFSQFAIAGFNNLGVFLVEFAQTNFGVTANTSILMQVVGKAAQVLMTPFAAALGDIKGWFWTSAFGGTLCTILALPMMVAGNFGGATAAWILVSGCLPIVSTFWILNAPLLATSVFPVDCRSRGTSLVLATAAGIQGFLPLVLEEIPNAYVQGGVLMVIAALGTIGIIWVRNQARRGRVIIYQRPELY